MNKITDQEIARMLGSEYIQNDNNSSTHQENWYWSDPIIDIPNGEISAWRIGDFKFHSDIDWLTIVVDLLEDKGILIENNKSTTKIISDGFEYSTSDPSIFKRLYIVIFLYCVWYNQNNAVLKH